MFAHLVLNLKVRDDESIKSLILYADGEFNISKCCNRKLYFFFTFYLNKIIVLWKRELGGILVFMGCLYLNQIRQN